LIGQYQKKIMKKLIVAASVVIMMAACAEKKHGAFVVQGLIENAPGKKVLLMELPFAAEKALVLDSATLDKKGSFTLRGMAKEEGIYAWCWIMVPMSFL
jgi:hypothetical protein